MPGVLIVESLAQVSAIIMLTKEGNQGRLGLLAGIDNCRFKNKLNLVINCVLKWKLHA